MSSKEQNLPFKGNWQEGFGGESRFLESPNYPHKIIRGEHRDRQHDDFKELPLLKKLTKEASDKYGFKFPNYHLVIGEELEERKDPKGEAYIVSDKIVGADPLSIKNPSSNLIGEVKDYLRGVIRYMKDSATKDEFLWDFGIKQTMYGHPSGTQEEDHLYHVDLEPIMTMSLGKAKKSKLAWKKEATALAISDLKNVVDSIENLEEDWSLDLSDLKSEAQVALEELRK